MTKKTRQQLESLVEALDDAPIDDEAARETISKLGIDVGALAKKLRATVAAADARERVARVEEARRAYATEVERLETRRREPKRSRTEQLATFRALLSKAPPSAVAMHFHKYESASDEELDELIRSLRHLLGGDDSA